MTFSFEEILVVMKDFDKVKSLVEQRDIFVLELDAQRKELRLLHKENEGLRSQIDELKKWTNKA